MLSASQPPPPPPSPPPLINHPSPPTRPPADESMTVAKVQVGLLGSAREIQKDLERIAAQADTDSPEGLHYILQGAMASVCRAWALARFVCRGGGGEVPRKKERPTCINAQLTCRPAFY